MNPDKPFDASAYPFFLPLYRKGDFEFHFENAVTMATHSPLPMALPGAALFSMTRGEILPTSLRDTSHFAIYRDFAQAPEAFVEEQLNIGE